METKLRAVMSDQELVRLYGQMVLCREFEESCAEQYTKGHITGFLHLYSGQEAVAVGVCEALRSDDYITSTHRGHGHCLAKGASVNRMFAELLGKGGEAQPLDARRAVELLRRERRQEVGPLDDVGAAVALLGRGEPHLVGEIQGLATTNAEDAGEGPEVEVGRI